MSLTEVVRSQIVQSNTLDLGLPNNEALVPMENMLMVIAQSNVPLQQEMQKTCSAFQQFMESMQAKMETLVQENAQLCKQLVEAESLSKQSEIVYQAKTQALQDVINNLSTQLLETNNRLEKLENSQTAIQTELKTVNQPDIAAIRTQLGTLETRAVTTETSHKTEITALTDQVNVVQKQSTETAAQGVAQEKRIGTLEVNYAKVKEFCNTHRHPTSYCTVYVNCLPGGVTPNAWTSATDTKLL